MMNKVKKKFIRKLEAAINNALTVNPLYFGIYENLIYHHWAGSRRMITRQDRIRIRELGGDGLKEDDILKMIAEENHKISSNVFEQITHQRGAIMDYLMGKNNIFKYLSFLNSKKTIRNDKYIVSISKNKIVWQRKI